MLRIFCKDREKCPGKAFSLWMRERLRAMGVRPINNIVDITNYVMLEYGQPMHAFDLRFVEENKIRVRRAQEGETITTLDGVDRTLTGKQLVIADGKKPIAIAGVMGGEYSGIMDDTTTIVFESACFNAASVRTTARDQGMRTDASSRYEKGLDPNNCLPALERACELVEMLDAGDVMDGKIMDTHLMPSAAVSIWIQIGSTVSWICSSLRKKCKAFFVSLDVHLTAMKSLYLRIARIWSTKPTLQKK